MNMHRECSACGHDDLTVTGLSQHLAKSHDPRCQALYSQSRSQTNNEAEFAMDGADEFEGDYHGIYNEDELEWPAEQATDSDLDEATDNDLDDDFLFEPEWEAPLLPHAEQDHSLLDDTPAFEHDKLEDVQWNARQDVEERAQGQHGFVVEPYPDPCTGQRILHDSVDHAANAAYMAHLTDDENIYYPFTSKIEWEVARWAKLRGSSLTVFLDLLSIDGVKYLFVCFTSIQLTANSTRLSLYGDPDFARYLTFTPEHHYADEDQTVCLFHDMNTGKWWWNTQKKLDQQCPGGTIIPIIISTDKTQVTLFCNKTAYPIYLTIGNIPKDIRRKPSLGSHILLAYLPTTQLEHITNKASCCRSIANLYHACLSRVLTPLQHAGLEGVNMRSSDGALRCCHPLFASFVGDYPEQLLATGIKFGECPKCDVDADNMGSNTVPLHLQKLSEVLDALAALDQGNLTFVHACAAVGIKPVIHPFWENLPFANIFQAVTPDVLHQLYQGLVKHLLGWLSAACGAAEIDARCRRLPPNHHIRLFSKGITTLSRVSGTEHAQMCRFLLGIIIDIRLPNNLNTGCLLRAVRGLLDFLYLAQYLCHSSETLQSLDEALDIFHANKLIFIDLGIRNNFNLPKLHAARHYPLMIALFGTTDNYNMEYTERLHIDLTKDAYRAMNHKDEFAQMTCWLERREKILCHQKYVSWRLADGHQSNPYHPRPPDMTFSREQVMTKHPSAKAVSLQKLVEDYGATHFRKALACYIAQQSRGNHSAPLRGQALDWRSVDACDHGEARVTLDCVHAKPQRRLGSRLVAHQSNTALVRLGADTHDLQGLRVGQIQVIFSLPPKSIPLFFPPMVRVPTHLAYVEWFTPFSPAPDRNSGLFKLSRSLCGGDRVTSIVSVADIERSVHLIPRFGVTAPRDWTSDTVLEDCDTFWFNPYIDRHTFSKFR
ncbi:uncharacterized protein F5891DRAFT_1200490 [Suillus fuscotomentosus]|uniref:Uncharacterized protein n=1 Tax=Suillus fuscotomentosus TaxID=1912939 RepID=A0AAD4DNT2_9AGAM|nr:uncharacterized protein F5891DRAFT_1200490 [Suillus fuscotomentosus]KAG1886895.1 hypothetical protein F5891DRAFT_1200490 [Suillus fuscotomentosus]